MEQTTINNTIGVTALFILTICIPTGIYYFGNHKRFQSYLIVLIAFFAAYTTCWSWEQDKILRGIPTDISTWRGRNHDLIGIYEKIHKKNDIITFSKTSTQRAEIKEILLENGYKLKTITQKEIIYTKKDEK